MDRGLVGVLLICVVGSTVSAWLFLRFKPGEKVTLIMLEAFEEELEKVKAYTLEFLVRQSIEHMVLRLSYLVRVDEQSNRSLTALLDSKGLLGASREALEAMPKIGQILSMMELFPEHPPVRFFGDAPRYEDRLRNVQYKVALLDLHEFFGYLPQSARPDAFGCRLVFAIVFHKGNVSFYEGVSDYYLDRRSSIGQILFEKGGEIHLFENRNVIVPRTEAYADVASAPAFGTIFFEDLEAGDVVRFSFTARNLAGPAILIARVFADGVEEKACYTFLGWPEQEY